MPIAAIPAYLGTDFKDASPGMRFGMYLKLWGVNRRSRATLWTTHDIDYKVSGQNPKEREYKEENKVSALTDAKKLNENDQKAMCGLLSRQQQSFDVSALPNASLRLDALATAPFTTGLGNEHPLENGFAFLNPYGLPYLAGSGVKGVLRQAARELASGNWGEAHGWNSIVITALFGRESDNGDTDHLRGALSFWDVIPQIAGDSLAVEIMTPHQGHYYQQNPQAGSASPHESGQPIPISFLTVPPKSRFVFHVQCNLAHLNQIAPELAKDESWKTLLEAAFQHAYQWLGFGAKTAVGYGAMEEDASIKERREQEIRNALEQQRKEQEATARQEALAKMTPAERGMCEFLDARADKNQTELSALFNGLKKNEWNGELKIEIAAYVQTLMQAAKKWKTTSEKKNPQKDNDYQETLKVMEWLQGK